MKKILTVLSIISIGLTACGGSGTGSNENSAAPGTTKKQAKANGQLLIEKADCIGCHHKENTLIGPSYIEIAEKYEATPENINLLAEKIIKGGKGVWGPILMSPHPGMPENDAKEMIEYILSLKK